MKQRKSTEDYLKTIYMLDDRNGVRSADIAAELHVSRPTVSVALRSLIREGYIRMDDRKLIFLTESGRQIARQTYERNRFFQDLLLRCGVDQQTALQDACEMEHSISDESFRAIRSGLYPVSDSQKDEK